MSELCTHVTENGECEKEKLDDRDPYCEEHMAMYSDDELNFL